MRNDIAWPKRPDWGFLDAAFRGSGLYHPAASVADIARSCRSRLVYLASPYSRVTLDRNGDWSALRSEAAGMAAARWQEVLARAAVTAVSPIVQSVAMVACSDPQLDPLDDEFWLAWCMPMLRASGAVVVPPIAGWRGSQGVWQEACWALRHNVRVCLIGGGENAD